MNDNPTLRDVAQATAAWLAAQYQAGCSWLARVGDIPIRTVGWVVLIGLACVFLVSLNHWIDQLGALMPPYRAIGHSWLHALRLAQADIEAFLGGLSEVLGRHRERRGKVAA